MTKLSIIVVTWNVKDELHRCLKSLYDNQSSAELEIIVVDNASDDGTVDLLKRHFQGVLLVANSDNRGFAAANNQGIENSRGEYILFLNPDTIVHPHSLDKLIEFLDDSKDVGACGPKLVDIDGKHTPSVGRYPTFRAILYGKTILRSLGIFRKHHKHHRAIHFNHEDVPLLSGAALMVKRDVIEEVGPMDEKFFMYYEDTDLCLRIKKDGWKIAYVPESVITHIKGRSSIQVQAKKRIMFYSSLWTYLHKHREKLATSLFGLVFKPGLLVKEIWNIFLATVTFIISTLLFNRRRQLKSLTKIKNSVIFLRWYFRSFLFRI